MRLCSNSAESGEQGRRLGLSGHPPTSQDPTLLGIRDGGLMRPEEPCSFFFVPKIFILVEKL